MNLKAVVTAGGRVDGEFARVIGTPVKALAPMNGTTMLSRTLSVLREAGIGQIAVIGGDEVRAACAGAADKLLAEQQSGAENVRTALRAWDAAEALVYATSDMPFITAGAVRDFLNAAAPGAVALPLTEWPDFIARFPNPPEFGVRFGSEKVVNGGVFLIPPGGARAIEAFAVRFFDARKSVWSMARLAGPLILARFLTGSLRVSDVESRASAVLGIPARAVRSAAPELAFDVDELAEYNYAIEHSAR